MFALQSIMETTVAMLGDTKIVHGKQRVGYRELSKHSNSYFHNSEMADPVLYLTFTLQFEFKLYDFYCLENKSLSTREVSIN